MASSNYKKLAKSAPAATTLTTLGTVPASKEWVVATLVVCNRGSTATSFRISHAEDGAADANDQYLYYDVPIPENDTFCATIGATADAADVFRCYAGNTNLTFTLYGAEVTP